MKIIRSEWLGGGLRSDYRMRKDGEDFLFDHYNHSFLTLYNVVTILKSCIYAT